MGYTWYRGYASGEPWELAQIGLLSLTPGFTLRRVRYGVSFVGSTSTLAPTSELANDFVAVGLVTISSVTGSLPPSPLTAPNDANPPLERWLWWETRRMRPRTWGAQLKDVVTWTDDGPVEPTDAKTAVAANVGAGNELHLFITWQSSVTDLWALYGNVSGQAWWSVLVED
jgi:hypothetical protein